MSTANSRELVGKCVLINDINQDTTFGGFLMTLRVQGVNPHYIHLVLKYLFISGIFAELANQTTNIANLNTALLGPVEIKIPPLREQSRIVEEVNRVFKVIDSIRSIT